MPESQQAQETDQPRFSLLELSPAEVLKCAAYGGAALAIIYGGWKTGIWPTTGPNP